MERGLQKLKQIALKASKAKKQIEKGEDVCRNILAVSIIYDHKKIKIDRKIELLDRYIPGLSSKKLDEFDLMNAKNEWLKLQTKECQSFLNSISITKTEDVKKFMNDLKGISKSSISISTTPKMKRVKEPKVVSSSKLKKGISSSTPELFNKISLKDVKKRGSISSMLDSVLKASMDDLGYIKVTHS